MSDNKEKNFKKFTNKANLMFNNKFDYSKFIYVKAKTKGIIICPKHGEFYQTPDKHTAPKSKGCPKCWMEINKNRIKTIKRVPKKIINKENFLKKCFEKHGNKFIYHLENYNGITKSKIKIQCPKHGYFEMSPRLHISLETGCGACGKEKSIKNNTDSYDFLIEQVKKIHKNKYLYPESNRDIYLNKKSIIQIECPIHGFFLKNAQKHISGQGCFHCKIEELIRKNILIGGFNESLFKEKPNLKEKKSTLYYLKINNGEYYKIGITTTNINSRVKGIKSKAKKFGEEIKIEVLKTKTSILYECFLLEQIILSNNKKERIYKNWSTELFKKDIYKKIDKYFF
jgi:hypothetical protein